MGRIEQRLELAPETGKENQPVEEAERIQLLALAEQLSTPELSDELRLEIAAQMRGLLHGRGSDQLEPQTEACERSEWIPPPRSAALLGAEVARLKYSVGKVPASALSMVKKAINLPPAQKSVLVQWRCSQEDRATAEEQPERLRTAVDRAENEGSLPFANSALTIVKRQ
jgi:hypothetical protein